MSEELDLKNAIRNAMKMVDLVAENKMLYKEWIKQKWQEWQELNGLKDSWQMTERHHEEFDKWLNEEAKADEV